MVAFGEYEDDGTASAMKARDYKDATDLVAHSLRPEGFDASEDGTGRGTPIVPVQHPIAIQERAVSENPDAGLDGKGWRDDGAAYTLEARQQTQAIAFTAKDHGGVAAVECSPTLRAGGHATSHANAGVMPAVAFSSTLSGTQHQAEHELSPSLKDGSKSPMAVAFDMRGREGGAMPEGPHDTANIRAASGGSSRSYVAFAQNSRDEVRFQGDGLISGSLAADEGMKQRTYLAASWGVRRLTPKECERLQGFPDGFTEIPWRGKEPADCPDGPRYKSLGNSMATPCMIFIGERIEAVRRLAQ